MASKCFLAPSDILKKMNFTSPGNSSIVLCQIPPPTATENSGLSFFAAIYAVLFLVGFAGNVAVLQSIYFIHNTLKRNGSRRQRDELLFHPDSAVMVYVVALCVVDLLVMTCLPLNIGYLLIGNWIFGVTACKMHFLMESVAKILSIFILTALSFERYLGICHPYWARSFRTHRAACLIIMSLSLSAMALLSPLLFWAKVDVGESNLFQMSKQMIGQVVGKNCRDNMPEDFFVAFVAYLFLLGYLLPAVLIISCYLQVLLKLRRHSVRMQNYNFESTSFGKVSWYTSGVTCFYFICWTPYWASLLHVAYLEYIQKASENGMKQSIFNVQYVLIMLCVHGLPYMNSALNWMFYAWMNTKLRRACTAATSLVSQQRSSRAASQRWLDPAQNEDNILGVRSCLTMPNHYSAGDLQRNVVSVAAAQSVQVQRTCRPRFYTENYDEVEL